MTDDARRAIASIRECIDSDRYALSVHFTERMQQRGLFWPDVQTIINDPKDVRAEGMDQYNRPKWIIGGDVATGGKIEIVCAIEVDESETEFITIYLED